MPQLRQVLLAIVCSLGVFAADSAAASDQSDVAATIKKWVSDFNNGDRKAFLAACAPRTSVVDAFPPYAWSTCTDWMNDYKKNSQAIQLTEGTLWIGEPSYVDIAGSRAYAVYPATFSDNEKDKSVVYKGFWAMTLHKTTRGWVFTGSGSAWSGT